MAKTSPQQKRKFSKAGETTSLTLRPKGAPFIEAEQKHQKQQELLLALEQVSRVLTVEVELEKILQDMATIVAKALGAKWVNFWQLTPDKKSVYITASYGMKPAYKEHSQRYPIRLGTAWIGRAVQTGKAWGTSDILTDPKLLQELGPAWEKAIKKQDYRALLCVPTISRKGPVGGVCVYYPDAHEFTDFEMRLVTVAANQAATSITNAQIFAELTAERNKTLAMINSLSDGIIMYDLEGTIILFNPKAEEIFWVKRSEVMGKKASEFKVRRNPLFANIKNIASLALSDFESKEIKIADPQRMTLQIINLPVRDPEDRKIGSMRVIHDITKEKEAEEIKSSFISIASHQLRTPLSGIKWALAMLLGKDLGNLNKEQYELMSKVTVQNDRLIDLVEDLLDASRIEEGRFGYVFKKAQLESLVQDALKALQPFLDKKRSIALSVKSPKKKTPLVNADPKKLGIAIFNIIDNAIKYTTKGTIAISFLQAPSSLFLQVADQGIGIPKEEQKFLFTKFFRASNAVRIQTEGSGLGLWIAQEIMKRHNGRILFESEERKGSTFSLQFPLKADDMPRGRVAGR
ncbi:MAG: hypothetical protein A3D64_01160 [Candidatus Wildermuthbacteria bacterium RIFCSPHIGHO2_02_FULL_49_9]|uniref:histidine kinase n=2 Tax=Candidatus Wildermuthiibacteriota TaxID=1817923 RepID=A0A1G2R0M4_9BACT|nr:MAG: hypothetical protein A2672_02490 [Candidatus Wildermuthbacteria bacterium RIFCSPHIGHO2_01_FULL_49_22b]OHA70470.1 MAG: hypothetical protein A3D64_01160 [Candidatus Wildermuthbacteria bacterium RIFCSPHIGHO2_02_FULL_49_9]